MFDAKIDKSRLLKMRQNYPLELKVEMSKLRIRQWYKLHHGKVYVSFSGGKDSTVLVDLVHSIYPDVEIVFVDTGLEYPEIRKFVKTFPNATWLRPKMNFKKVIEKYGYPAISKEQSKYIREVQRGTTKYMEDKRRFGKNGTRSGMVSKKWQFLFEADFKVSDQCCDVMKKHPLHQYEKNGKKPFIGTMAEDSMLRKQSYIRYGCNMSNGKQSRPMMFWNEDDVWEYIRSKDLAYSKIYDMGEKRTGCMFCMFGVHMEKSDLFNKNRFQRMKVSHPNMYKYCIKKLGIGKVLDAINVNYN
jgi:3'-phosphoadenosine 5'-phosphosulfate sulfotransferase (PAPS reductase)/FAD synthetase